MFRAKEADFAVFRNDVLLFAYGSLQIITAHSASPVSVVVFSFRHTVRKRYGYRRIHVLLLQEG